MFLSSAVDRRAEIWLRKQIPAMAKPPGVCHSLVPEVPSSEKMRILSLDTLDTHSHDPLYTIARTRVQLFGARTFSSPEPVPDSLQQALIHMSSMWGASPARPLHMSVVVADWVWCLVSSISFHSHGSAKFVNLWCANFLVLSVG